MKTLKVVKGKRAETVGLYFVREYIDFGTTIPFGILNKVELQMLYDDGYYNLEGEIQDVV